MIFHFNRRLNSSQNVFALVVRWCELVARSLNLSADDASCTSKIYPILETIRADFDTTLRVSAKISNRCESSNICKATLSKT